MKKCADEEGGKEKREKRMYNKGTYIHNWHMCSAQNLNSTV